MLLVFMFHIRLRSVCFVLSIKQLQQILTLVTRLFGKFRYSSFSEFNVIAHFMSVFITSQFVCGYNSSCFTLITFNSAITCNEKYFANCQVVIALFLLSCFAMFISLVHMDGHLGETFLRSYMETWKHNRHDFFYLLKTTTHKHF